MRILKNHPILKLMNAYLIDASQPSNISYLWNFGSLLAVCLIIQIITGITLAMHYNSSVLEAFNSIEHIMRDVNNGWLIRYLHANTASAFFFLVYLHIGRGMYYGSYKSPRTLVWVIGTIILVVMMATAFLGYVLPYGQMSLWGATVITNLMSAIPWLGQDIVEFIWGGFSVNNATLNRFFSLHYVLPFLLAVLVLLHLISLHDKAGSGNPLGVGNYVDRITFSPYYTFKDLITIFIFIFILSAFVCFVPNLLGDSENYVMANPMQTPPAIVPEWYLLPFYAILRSIPNKLLGVIAMFSALVIIISMSFLDVHKFRGFQYKPLNKIVFYIFVAVFFLLLILGAKHVESPYIELGQIFTSLYFMYFLIFIPFLNFLEYNLEFKNLILPRPHNSIPLPHKQSIFNIFKNLKKLLSMDWVVFDINFKMYIYLYLSTTSVIILMLYKVYVQFKEINLNIEEFIQFVNWVNSPLFMDNKDSIPGSGESNLPSSSEPKSSDSKPNSTEVPKTDSETIKEIKRFISSVEGTVEDIKSLCELNKKDIAECEENILFGEKRDNKGIIEYWSSRLSECQNKGEKLKGDLERNNKYYNDFKKYLEELKKEK